MIHLTRQEQLVLCSVLGLLLIGWAVKTYRTAHPPSQMELLRSGEVQTTPVAQEKSNP